LYQCSDGHSYTPQGLLAEQAKLAARILRDVEESLENQLAFSAELASRAQVDGRSHLLRLLERSLDSSRETLGFVQASLRDHDGLPD